jgi:hypothetical protein
MRFICDPEIKGYLKLADEEVSRIAMVLNRAHQMNESKAFKSASAALSRMLWPVEEAS